MSNSKRSLAVCVVLLVAGVGAFALARSRTVTYRSIGRGGRIFFGKVGVSGANQYLVSGQPGVVFGTVTRPGTEEEFSYVLVFKNKFQVGDGALGVPFVDGSSSGNNRRQKSCSAVTIDDRRIEAQYEVEWNETSTAVSAERLLIDGKARDLAEGNVFLVDLSGKEPVILQKKVKNLPRMPYADEFPDVERLSAGIVKALEIHDAESRAFVAAARN